MNAEEYTRLHYADMCMCEIIMYTGSVAGCPSAAGAITRMAKGALSWNFVRVSFTDIWWKLLKSLHLIGQEQLSLGENPPYKIHNEHSPDQAHVHVE